MLPPRPAWRHGALVALLALSPLLAAPARACVGSNCMTIWSTADGRGELTIDWDFANRALVQTFKALCAGGQCLYSTIDPGFLAEGDLPHAGFFTLADGTPVDMQLVASDAGASVKINGVALAGPGDRVRLGSAGALHAHPSWQLKLAEGVEGDFALSFKLTTTSAQYGESAVFSVLLSNRPAAPTETPTLVAPTATPTPTVMPEQTACAGDCNGDGMVTVSELIGGVASALGSDAPCAALDDDGDGTATIGELIAAVNAALGGCPAPPTPTETPAATLAAIQAAIFSPRCATALCHDAVSASGGLVLADGASHDALVGATPTIEAASLAGMLRVDPGDPDNSFLMSKLAGPPLGQGSRMPLTGPVLDDPEMALIRAWILAGAPR